ncbi:site-specific integrase [Bacteroides sp. GD17]|jgi:integrase|uniref:tyrosine-type recombinase/integrase n=1 Tax=Bacteroides sp. GD17 TaxID=3139826 RepID=UPI0025F8427C|nr:site-specific integrase [uncultured Bacteroides sp.]
MHTIDTYSRSLIEETKQAGRYSTAGIYTSTINSFLRFAGDSSITFSSLTPGLIKQYEDQLLSEGRSHNTLSTYMRMLRSICHQAENEGIPFTSNVDELFNFVFTGYEPTTKRAIAPALFRRLLNLNLDKKPTLSFSRDIFLLSFYLRGIPFVDLAYLRKTDVRHNTIYYYRHKTHQQLSVHIESYAAQILQKYKNKDASSPYLLPILSLTGEDGYKQYRSALRLYNQHLHRLSKMMRLSTPLTSYVARHSWATTAKDEGVAISVISESLGHTSEKVTHVYLASFDNNAMSKANRKVIATIHPNKKKGNKR